MIDFYGFWVDGVFAEGSFAVSLPRLRVVVCRFLEDRPSKPFVSFPAFRDIYFSPFYFFIFLIFSISVIEKGLGFDFEEARVFVPLFFFLECWIV